MRAPARARSSAAARPIPLEPPVISAVRGERSSVRLSAISLRILTDDPDFRVRSSPRRTLPQEVPIAEKGFRRLAAGFIRDGPAHALDEPVKAARPWWSAADSFSFPRGP